MKSYQMKLQPSKASLSLAGLLPSSQQHLQQPRAGLVLMQTPQVLPAQSIRPGSVKAQEALLWCREFHKHLVKTLNLPIAQ